MRRKYATYFLYEGKGLFTRSESSAERPWNIVKINENYPQWIREWNSVDVLSCDFHLLCKTTWKKVEFQIEFFQGALEQAASRAAVSVCLANKVDSWICKTCLLHCKIVQYGKGKFCSSPFGFTSVDQTGQATSNPGTAYPRCR